MFTGKSFKDCSPDSILAANPEQQKNSAYARRFQQEGAHTNLTAEGLTFWIKEPAVRTR